MLQVAVLADSASLYVRANAQGNIITRLYWTCIYQLPVVIVVLWPVYGLPYNLSLVISIRVQVSARSVLICIHPYAHSSSSRCIQHRSHYVRLVTLVVSYDFSGVPDYLTNSKFNIIQRWGDGKSSIVNGDCDDYGRGKE
jgi:hypothetical protein